MRDLTASDLFTQMRVAQSGDWWADTMCWWFAVAGEMYERGLFIPEEWKYHLSPLGGKESNQYEAEVCEKATDGALLLFGRALSRYAKVLKKAGCDY